MDKYAVIMAGGGGTRFWPLSRQQMPKQLLNISGNDVMLNETIKRLADIIDLKNILVVTNKKQGDIIKELIINDLPRENILLEPMGKNTSACITYAAMVINSRCPDAVMCVLPSDHYITDEERFRRAILKACTAAEKSGKLVAIGIRPAFPATGYGYIRFINSSDSGFEEAYEAEEFVEKPSPEKARSFLESGNYLWNSGMFIWKVSTIIENMGRYLPRLYRTMSKIRDFIGTEKEEAVLDTVYSELQNISIDFGIMERSDEVLVIPGDFGWNDVGSWDALGSIFPTDENGNIVRAKYVGINTRNSVIFGNGRLIATIGCENMIIAETADALLICPKDKAQEVRNIVELLKSRGMEEYI